MKTHQLLQLLAPNNDLAVRKPKLVSSRTKHRTSIAWVFWLWQWAPSPAPREPPPAGATALGGSRSCSWVVAAWPCTSHLQVLSLSFSDCKMGRKVSYCCRIRHTFTWELLQLPKCAEQDLRTPGSKTGWRGGNQGHRTDRAVAGDVLQQETLAPSLPDTTSLLQGKLILALNEGLGKGINQDLRDW